MGTFISTIIIGGILYLIWLLKHHGVKLDESTIGIDNPYYDNRVNKMPLDKYEEQLDKIFDYDKVNNSVPVLDELVYENIDKETVVEEKDDKIKDKEVDRESKDQDP